MHSLTFTACFGIIFLFTSTCYADKFPYREKYPEVEVIELTTLKSGYDKEEYILIDLRSKSEFDAIHIDGAINLPYGHLKFMDNLLTLAKNNPDKKIAVYDNGINCIKCYRAAEDALYSMLTIYAFDAGIANWAKNYPSSTLLYGKMLSDSENMINSDKEFKKKCLDFETFKKEATTSDAVVIDARDPIQRTKKLPGLEKAIQVPLDKLVKNIIDKGNMKDKQLYIFDQVGGQVRWLMQNLTDQGYSDFFFLSGGATAVLKEQVYR
jgi:rhodanese-related sulfurtransferase